MYATVTFNTMGVVCWFPHSSRTDCLYRTCPRSYFLARSESLCYSVTRLRLVPRPVIRTASTVQGCSELL